MLSLINMIQNCFRSCISGTIKIKWNEIAASCTLERGRALDYPEDNELEIVQNWQYDESNSYEELMEYVRSLWAYANSGYWTQDGNKYSLSTAGWSGNESIVCALKDNYVFWALCWYFSKRGGHYEFIVPERFMRNGGCSNG